MLVLECSGSDADPATGQTLLLLADSLDHAGALDRATAPVKKGHAAPGDRRPRGAAASAAAASRPVDAWTGSDWSVAALLAEQSRAATSPNLLMASGGEAAATGR